jgi:predicted amidohydrolase
VFVLAAAQFGSHPPGLACYGNAMIVDPWGAVLARAPEGEGVVVAELDFGHQDKIRKSLPALSHRRTEVLGL